MCIEMKRTIISGSSHIRSVQVGVEYRNCCRTLDGANSIKTDLHNWAVCKL